jgi:hypothetical protein
VAVADYVFVEAGPNSLRYEVRCNGCGEAYCEVHTPYAPDFAAAGRALAVRPPDPVPPAATHRQRWAVRLAEAKTSASRLADRASSWIESRRNAFGDDENCPARAGVPGKAVPRLKR